MELGEQTAYPVGRRVASAARSWSKGGQCPEDDVRGQALHLGHLDGAGGDRGIGAVPIEPSALEEWPWPGGTQSRLYTVGNELDHIVERIMARPPTSEEAEELGLQKGVSVIVLRKISIDTEGRVVDVSDVIRPGDRTELVFTTRLDRW